MSNKSSEFKYFSNNDLDRITDNYMSPIFDKIFKKYSFNNILDYGCGNGTFGIYLSQNTQCKIIGIDGSKYALEQASKIGYNETYLIEDFSTIKVPLQDNTVDFVILKDVLEHLLDPHFVLNEAYRVCASKGLLLLHVPNHFPLIYRLKFLFTNDIDTQNYFPDSNDWNFPHIRFFKHNSIVEKAKKIGFNILEDYSYYFTAYLPKTSKVPVVKHFQRYLAQKYPNDFAIGFTLLCQKR